jgi:hypothetical protein
MPFFKCNAAAYAEGVEIIQPSEEAEGKGVGRSRASQVARNELPWVSFRSTPNPERVASTHREPRKANNGL